MKIKRPVLCSVAVLATSSGAYAADAVVVEPEPVEYVRVCDAYGSGFFFIPGTETCIRLSGYVRSSFEKLYVDGEIGGDLAGAPRTGAGSDTTLSDPTFQNWANRGRLNLDTRNETEFGTLRALYRLEGGSSNVDVDIDLDVALISLAGFRAGFAGANYWSTNHGFGAVNAESLAFNAGGIIYEDGFYGFDDATIFDYTFSQDNFAITIGAEDTRISYGRDNFNNATNNGGTDGRVNFYAGFNYSGDFGTLAFTAAHDSLATKVNSLGVTTDIGGWAYKVSANIDLSSIAPGAFLAGYYLNDGDYNTDYLHTALISENPDEIYGIAGQVNLSDTVELWANYWVAVGGDAFAGGSPSEVAGVAGTGNLINEGDVDQFSIGLNWFPSATPGFHIKASYTHGQVENSGSFLVNGTAASQANGTSFDYDAFIVSLRRDF
ncbi:MAG: porin [Pseudomonadota bacterium]